MRALSAVSLVLASVALGCSTPSIRMVERGNTYFERCHAADRDPEVSDAHRLQCWEAWLDHYTDAQPVERIRHARERVTALAIAVRDAERAAEATGGGEAIAAAEIADAGAEPVVSEPPGSAPTEATAATAAVEPPPAASCPARPDAVPGVACPSPPDDAVGPCAEVCNPRWYACVSRCRSYERRCLNACKLEHRTCMAGCF